jgi:carboxyl-terminal processing protease
LLNNPKLAMPLTLDAIFEEQSKLTTLWDEISTFDEKSINLTVSNSEYNASLLVIYPSERTANQNQIDALKTNHYLNEAITIIEEYNALK